jgi:PPOX class probable F420-dependent enzyme
MLDADAIALLQRPLIARFATNGADGYPHTVPVWFELTEGGDLLVVSERTGIKVRNVQRDPRATITMGGDEVAERAYMIRGTVTIEEDPGQAVTGRLVDRYEPEDRRAAYKEQWRESDIIVLRMRVERVTQVYG